MLTWLPGIGDARTVGMRALPASAGWTPAVPRRSASRHAQRHRRARRYLACLAVVACALIGAGLVAAAPASAGTTKASTFSKTGTDSVTGSTASSGGMTGTTAPGHTINWTLSYRNTTGAPAQVNITDPIAGNQAFVSGSLKTPPGVAGQWSTNGGGTYTGTEPASGVNAVGATGQSGPGSTGEQSLFQPPSSGFDAGSSRGDGWEALFIGGNVYNIHHHRPAGSTTLTTLDCHSKTTAAECPGYPVSFVPGTSGQPFSTVGGGSADIYDTSYAPSAAVDAATGRIYFPVGVNGQGGIGVMCADVLTQTSCGYTQLADSPLPNAIEGGEGHPAISGGAVIGNHYYLVDAQANIYCFNTATNGSCGAPYPIKAVPGYNGGNLNTTQLRPVLDSRLQAFDNRYVFGNITEPTDGSRDLTCIDTTTNTLCPGFPVKSYGATDYFFTTGGRVLQANSVLAPILDAGGGVTGICGMAAPNTTSAPFKCYTVGGGSPASAVPTPWPQQVGGDTITRAGLGSITRIGDRDYFAYSNETSGGFQATYACWSFATNSACQGFDQTTSGKNVRVYTLRQDPYNPGCIWELGDAGVFEVFSATFGGTTCKEGAAQVALTPAAYYCDGKAGHVTGWNNLVLGGLTSADYDAASVTITDANGDPVPGWTARVFPNTQQTINISSIPYSGADTTLHVSVNIAWGTHAVIPATLYATFSGDPVQVCFQTVAGPAQCSADQSISNSGNAVTVGANGVGDGPDGNDSGAAVFSEPADPNAPSCRADLSITKTASAPIVSPGGRLSYTLVVANHGPDAASGVQVSDPIPPGLTVVSAQPSQGSCTTTGAITCSLGTLADGGSAQILVTANLAPGASGSVTNCAATSASQTDPNPGNNRSCATTTIVTPPPPPPPATVDLTIVKHVNHAAAELGQVLTYTIDVKNSGPGTVPDAIVTDTSVLPLHPISIKPSQGSCSRGVPFKCNLGTLTSGATATITIRAIPVHTGSEINSATIASGCSSAATCPPGGPPRNTNPNPNSHAKTVVYAHLRLVKTISKRVVKAGQTVSYGLKVSNPNLGTLKNVQVCDRLPLGLVFVSSSPRARLSNGSQCWSFKSLRAHGSKTIKLIARVLRGARRNLINHAIATAPGVPPARAHRSLRVIPPPPPPTPVTG